MGVYIKGMEMPKPHMCCYCDVWSYCFNEKPHYNEMKSVCPLAEVPEHGRLIDADTVVTIQTFDEQREERDLACVTVAEALDKWSDEGCPPTIIPADGEAADNA